VPVGHWVGYSAWWWSVICKLPCPEVGLNAKLISNRRRRCAMRDPSQFNTDRIYSGRWTINFSNPPINMFVPKTIVQLGALMTDLEADFVR
jgi:hypothetical protein